MNATQNALRLRIVQPDGKVVNATSEGENVILGSGPGAAIHLSDPSVSQLHVMLKVDRNRVLAIDLGSENGTHLGDRRLNAPEHLQTGDVLRVGGCEVRVTLDRMFGPSVPASPAPPGLRRAVAAAAMALEPEKPVVTPVPLPATDRAQRAAWKLMSGPLPLEETPTAQEKVLQVSLSWGAQLLAVEHFAEGVRVEAGERRGCAFQVPSELIGRHFVLAQSGHSTAKVFLPPAARFRARVGGRELDEGMLRGSGVLRQEGSREVLRLGLRDTAQVSLEGLNFGIRFVKPAPALHVRGVSRGDARFLALAAACLLLFVGGLVWVTRRPAAAPELATHLEANAQFVQLMMKRPPTPRPAPRKLKSGAEEGAKAAKEEGKFGRKDAKQEEADPSLPGSPLVTRNAREDHRSKVMKSGLVALLNGPKGAASNVLGPGGLGSGINQALGGLKAGAGLTDARGLGGLGARGEGIGGGGTGLGIGGLGTKGAGHGKGGYGDIDLGGRDKETVRIVPGKTTVVGGLSKEVIARVIKQHQSEIKYCYEAQLNQHPELSGKVAVLFNIDGSGTVADANVAESSLGSQTAEQCMLSKIRRWKFPEPVGGGTVTVTFPWVFKPAAGGV